MNKQVQRAMETKEWVAETLSAFFGDINGPDDMVRILNREHRRRQMAIDRGMR